MHTNGSSPGIDPRADLEFGSIPALARSAAARFGDAEAIVDGDVRCSFAELAIVAVPAKPAGRASCASPL